MKFSQKKINGFQTCKTEQIVLNILDQIDFDFAKNKSGELKNILNTECELQGWTKKLKIDPRINWSVQYYFDETAIIYYFSNKARSAIDLLKIQHLYNNKKIKRAIYITLKKKEAKKMGDNLTNYETFLKELIVFNKIINCPLLIIGMG